MLIDTLLVVSGLVSINSVGNVATCSEASQLNLPGRVSINIAGNVQGLGARPVMTK